MDYEEAHRLYIYDPISGLLLYRTTGTGRTSVIAGYTATDGYRQVYIRGTQYMAHRVIWLMVTGECPVEIDHDNGVKHDNRFSNLLDGTHGDNMKNKKRPVTNTSGVMGVSWYKPQNKWRAQIQVDGVCRHLGYFTDKDDAAKARKEAEIKYGFHPNHGRVAA